MLYSQAHWTVRKASNNTAYCCWFRTLIGFLSVFKDILIVLICWCEEFIVRIVYLADCHCRSAVSFVVFLFWFSPLHFIFYYKQTRSILFNWIFFDLFQIARVPYCLLYKSHCFLGILFLVGNTVLNNKNGGKCIKSLNRTIFYILVEHRKTHPNSNALLFGNAACRTLDLPYQLASFILVWLRFLCLLVTCYL